MPLEEGKSKAAFSHNVATEMNTGKPQKQAVAIAYSESKKDAEAHLTRHDALCNPHLHDSLHGQTWRK